MTANKPETGDGPGTTVGRYRLIRRLGTGSFATVWLGRDDDLDVAVAVKVLSPQWADDDDVRQRFVTEARLMRRINDARITHVYDIGQLEDGRPYFVMDYADGGSLNDVRRHHPSPVRALRLCAETCRALAVLHDYDVVHRDVTPGNVLLNRSRPGPADRADQGGAEGPERPGEAGAGGVGAGEIGAVGGTRILIADLGVANDRAAAIGLPMTAGTPGYMSPEQARGEHVDHRADIYALAALTYAMLTGRPPYGVQTLEDVLDRSPDQRPEPVADRFGAPALLDTLLAAGLSVDPNLRPPTAGLLGDALDRIADDLASRLARRNGSARDRSAEDGERDLSERDGDGRSGDGEGGECGGGAAYETNYEAMATMIRPATGISAPPATSPTPAAGAGAETAPNAVQTEDGEADAVLVGEAAPPSDQIEAVAPTPLPVGRIVLLSAVGLLVFTVIALLAAFILR